MHYRFSILLFISFFIYSCKQHNEKNKQYYCGIKKQDTALLSIIRLEDKFYGQLEVRYGGQALKDSGNVSGSIRKDTLRGEFHFMPYGGGKWKRKPIIFLEKNGQLILGRGIIHTFLQISYFDETTPFEFNNSQFIFEEIKDSMQR